MHLGNTLFISPLCFPCFPANKVSFGVLVSKLRSNATILSNAYLAHLVPPFCFDCTSDVSEESSVELLQYIQFIRVLYALIFAG